MNQKTILIVDDEQNLRDLLKIYLQKQGWAVIESSTGLEALDSIGREPIHLVILDIMMPELNGWEVCKRIRETSNIPILLLTAINATKDKIHGLNLGADDYLTKPFEIEELVARVQAIFRRASAHSIVTSEKISVDEITIDLAAKQVKVNDNLVYMTHKEFELLFLLASNPYKVFSREVLLDRIWGIDFYGDFRTIDQHVKNIRCKFKKGGCSFNPIKTVWGFGYQLQRTCNHDEQHHS
ncbi:response regulator transcription factor [Anaerospora hongkongensis]|uniref:response regulator transcription factor n=1 Tax=Anaerospora hongkongensis TaxID=244830 RepID=UPI00289CFBBD|nr:response regulator transcription factor [Anaerospora hongkongensis]